MYVLATWKMMINAPVMVSSTSLNFDEKILQDMVLHQDLQLTTVESTHTQNSLSCSREYGQQSFRLPPSSPYDKFLKAAGC
ncbi:hypothetical protein MTR67_048684 [Solanum verrucosum]|uniref:Uncharacterized protein n=1 Tax=Solanum verrucosum TaxID=315347 RepID=A0AAF0V131_SOLVR|nr:hypothetical protein MTR67_048684 [Solanum verrucosum]